MDQPLDQPLSDDEIQELAAFLDAQDDETLSIEALDGFLTALAAGPVAIPPTEWLSVVWSEQGPAFADEAEATRIISFVMRLSNAISRALLGESEDDVLAPIVYQPDDDANEDAPDEVYALEWAAGFREGLAFFPDFVEKAANRLEDMEELLGAFTLLAEGPDPRSGMKLSLKDRRELLDVAMDAACILADYARNGFNQQPYRKEEEPGRNDPCPCGSGKKFKKCCGAADKIVH